jgi:hypothetical protein
LSSWIKSRQSQHLFAAEPSAPTSSMFRQRTTATPPQACEVAR